DLYLHLLDESVAELKGETLISPPVKIEVQGEGNCYFPENFMEEQSERVYYYRRISEIFKEEELEELRKELLDRFGRIPAEAENLLELHRMRILASMRGWEKIARIKGKWVLEKEEQRVFFPEKKDLISFLKKIEL
ncbi:MAG TPA: TRCF domain-containing protein, partial [bacterium]|nr:TRCF domain-containing protein [bacterium]